MVLLAVRNACDQRNGSAVRWVVGLQKRSPARQTATSPRQIHEFIVFHEEERYCVISCERNESVSRTSVAPAFDGP